MCLKARKACSDSSNQEYETGEEDMDGERFFDALGLESFSRVNCIWLAQ